MNRAGLSNTERFPVVAPGLCRVCGEQVVPPKQTFCGPRCLRDFFMQTDWKRVRLVAYHRDGGRCMECGKRVAESDFDAHHIVPICEGGDEWALDNIETLCRGCHKAVHAGIEAVGVRR